MTDIEAIVMTIYQFQQASDGPGVERSALPGMTNMVGRMREFFDLMQSLHEMGLTETSPDQLVTLTESGMMMARDLERQA